MPTPGVVRDAGFEPAGGLILQIIYSALAKKEITSDL